MLLGRGGDYFAFFSDCFHAWMSLDARWLILLCKSWRYPNMNKTSNHTNNGAKNNADEMDDC